MNQESIWKNKNAVKLFINKERASIPHSVEQLETMLHILKHDKNSIKTFIDLGAGDGILSSLIMENHNESRGFAIDFSDFMIDVAYKKLSNYEDRIKILKADISVSEWQNDFCKNDKFDLIVSGYCIHHFNHGRKYELYQEIYNLLDENGLFINIEHVASNSAWGEMLSDEAYIDGLLENEKSHDGSTRTREQVREYFHGRPNKRDNILLPVNVQCEWLKLIGFDYVDVFFKSFEFSVFGGKKSNEFQTFSNNFDIRMRY